MALRCVSLCSSFARRPACGNMMKGLGKHCSRPSNSRAATRAFSKEWNPLRWYNEMLEKYPIRTKCLTSGVLFGVGDYIAQKVTNRQSSVDHRRILRATIYGSVILAPLAHVHFNFLEWLVVKKIATRASLVPFVKMFFDQFGYFSPMTVAIYHGSMGAMEGLSYNDTIERLKELYWPTLKTCWMIWPAVMVVNFKFVPVAHQLNFVLAVSLVWATILSVIRAPDVTSSSKSGEIEPADIISLSDCAVEVVQR